LNSYLKGHEFSPLIYNYNQRKGTIEFLEKLDRQEITTGRQSIGLEFQFNIFQTSIDIFLYKYSQETDFFTPYQASYEKKECVCSVFKHDLK
jgi:hypothetical protein